MSSMMKKSSRREDEDRRSGWYLAHSLPSLRYSQSQSTGLAVLQTQLLSLYRPKRLVSWIQDMTERRNEAFQKVCSVTSVALVTVVLLFVAQTNLHRPQPVDLSVCGQQQECRQHHQNSGNIVTDTRRDHYTTRHIRSQTSRLCLLSHLTGPQSESGSSSPGYGSMFAMSLHPDLSRLDEQDGLELEWSAFDLPNAHLRYFWKDCAVRTCYR
jgi:hypothetical protein